MLLTVNLHSPAELGNATTLWLLDLSNNFMTSTVPTELGALSILNYMYLEFNYFNGTIPSELGDLPHLQELYLNSNDLSGEVPDALELLALNITIFDLSNNTLLWGEIAEDLCSIEELYFDCSEYLCGCNCSCSGAVNETGLSLPGNLNNAP